MSGSALGAPDHIRLSFAISHQAIDDGMDRIERLKQEGER